MASNGWVAELYKKEHKNWVMVGCALNIAKKGIAPKIQNKMETWYQSLISSPPLQSLPSCTCAPLAPKCATCVTWEKELKRHHKSGRPKICWDNSDRTQWGSPTGAWEIAKVFMPAPGNRAKDVIDADGTDIGGLLNLLEWCPFINPPVSRTLLSSARDECRNCWAHAAKQEICDADVPTIFSHLNNLLSDPVFSTELSAQKASNDLQDLSRQGLINVRESEVEALHLLRQCLEADLRKCQEDLAFTLRHLSQVQEQSNANKYEITTLRQQMEEESRNLSENVSTILIEVAAFNKFLNQRDDLSNTIEVICDDLDELSNDIQKVVKELNAIGLILPHLETNLKNLYCEVQKVTKNVSISISRLQEDVMEVKEEVKTLKHKAQVGPHKGDNDDDDDGILCTAPIELTEFTGRKSELEWLERNLVLLNPEKKPGASSCVKTICGLGGCGKTSLAIEFARRYKHRFPGGVFWVNGESNENVRKSVVEILTFVNISASVTDNIEDILNKFLSWLSKMKRPWLLVVDNADELNDPTCPAGVKKVCKGMWQTMRLPRKYGHILVTTRANATESRTFLKISNDDCLKLHCFREEEGALFLMQRTGLGGNDLDPDAICLATELGSLPLALEQAAAYISSSPLPLNFKDYLNRYKAVKLRLLKQQHATAVSLEAEHRLSIHTTWLMNFDYVKKRSPAAAKIMRISAFLESEFIPFNVINPGSPELNQEELRESSSFYSDIGDILKILSSYSLFTVDQQCKLFRVHKLVQEVVRDSLTKSERLKTLAECVRVLRFAFLQFPAFENFKLANLYELDVGDKRIVFSLLLNFLKLTTYMEEEMNVPKENNNGELFRVETFELCKFVYELTKNRNSLLCFSSELSDFYLKLLVYGDSDPNWLLSVMVDTSIIKEKSFTTKGRDEGKNLIDSAMQKMFEFEKSGVVIEADVKFLVCYYKAGLFFKGEVEKFYNALLELESLDLPISEAHTAELQMNVATAEYQKGNSSELMFKRLMKALEIARRVYPGDDPKLLHLLELANIVLSKYGKFEEAKICAKEMRDIYVKLPPSSDDMMRGLRNSFSLMCQSDHVLTETNLLEHLEIRWPHIYSCVKDGYVNNCIPYIDDGSEELVAIFLLSIMRSFRMALSKESEPNFSADKLAMYLRIGEIFVSLRLSYYCSNAPDMLEAYFFLTKVNLLLGTDEMDGSVCCQVPVFVVNRQGFFEQCQSGPCADSSPNLSSRYRDAGNGFFSLGDYSRSLEFYNKALKLNQGDAHLLTNRVDAQVRLSKQKGQSEPLKEQQNVLQRALQYSISAISADPSWVKGYYWKAVCLAELGQRGASLAATAVAECLFPLQWTQIPAVVEHFGCYIVKEVTTSEDLRRAVLISENGLVIVVRSGKYVLTQPLKVPSNAVIVGLGKVEVTCVKGVPLFLDKTVYIDNIELTPSADFIRMNKEHAKKCLDCGQLDQALSLYSKVLATCPENTRLLTARASTYLKAAKEKRNKCERESLLQLGLEDTKTTIRADPSWLLGYFTRAAIMTELGRKHEALASAAVFNHLSSGRDISSVIQRYGTLQIHVVESLDELSTVLEEIAEPEGVNQILLMKEGEYLFENSVEINPAIVVVGLGKVIVSCKTGAPFNFRREHFVENVEL